MWKGLYNTKKLKEKWQNFMFLDQFVCRIEIKTKLTPEEMRLWQTYFQEENEKIRKGHVRIQEKFKDIRRNFSKAVPRMAVQKLYLNTTIS